MPLPAPQTETELFERANLLNGMTLGNIASQLSINLPRDLKRNKGFVGQLLEYVLGADAGHAPTPDFSTLNIELKTIPILNQRVKESTFVSTVNLTELNNYKFTDSSVYKKLQHVLWVPILQFNNKLIADYTILKPILWKPSQFQIQQFAADWQELTDLLALGHIDQVHAGLGEWLHIRPKGANAKVLTAGNNTEGRRIQTLPRGFYLRNSFTQNQIMLDYFKDNPYIQAT